MEYITDSNSAHAKRVCKDLKIRNVKDYYDLYVESDTALLADVFEKIQNVCLKIYDVDPVCFLFVPGFHDQKERPK